MSVAQLKTNPVAKLNGRLEMIETDSLAWKSCAPLLKATVVDLSKQEIHLPGSFLKRMQNAGVLSEKEVGSLVRPAPTGVCGLLVEPSREMGWVTRLHVRILDPSEQKSWKIADNLPFDRLRIQKLLIDLARVLNLPPNTPERLSFEIWDELGEAAKGQSMDLAAILAILSALNKAPDLLSAACSLVEPFDVSKLRAVKDHKVKMRAFQREYDRGSLLIRHHDTPPDFDDYFDHVWVVGSLKGLAHYLQKAGLLTKLFEGTVLSGDELIVLKHTLETLIEDMHNYSYAIDLAGRILACEKRATPSIVSEIEQLMRDAERHCGSLDVSQREELALAKMNEYGVDASYSEVLDATVSYAAALYDPHRFEEIVNVLLPWVERVNDDPQIVSVFSRYSLFNTLGRAFLALGDPRWEELFRRSLALQAVRCPEEMQRTRNYLIHGLLATSQLTTARQELAAAESDPNQTAFSKKFLSFYRAELARQEGEIWVDETLEQTPNKRNYVDGFYFQATARQPGRDKEDVKRRFRLAETGFQSDTPNSVLVFLMHLARLGHDLTANNPTEWHDTVKHLKTSLAQGVSDYYVNELNALGATPSFDAAHRLFSRVVYF